ncbi:hypothetical protein GCM10023337_02960 [Paenalcaligenes hermetiae]|uniref:Uncharacterized protein n=1 Tax=Paenalcaligenes hermetiae TaxID=1157987 RepID=A0ABP9LT75_9BURK
MTIFRFDPVRDKFRHSGRGRIARTAQPSYNGIAADNQGSLRQGMPEVTPVEIRAAVAHSAQEPTEATQEWLNAAPERRRNLRPSGRGGCQCCGCVFEKKMGLLTFMRGT